MRAIGPTHTAARAAAAVAPARSLPPRSGAAGARAVSARLVFGSGGARRVDRRVDLGVQRRLVREAVEA